MNHFINTIANALQVANQSPLTLDALSGLSEKYPYAAIIQLLYAAALKDQKDEKFEAQWQKTLLYFNNTLIVQHQFLAADTIPQAHTNSVAEVTIIEQQPDESVTTEKDIVPVPGIKLEHADPAKTDLLFTPFYTVDYFASLGIKISEEANAADQFGNQLKSFTAWLKEMRRLPGTAVNNYAGNKSDVIIEKMAEKSLHGENVETAAMAEVWAKQGNIDKAIGIYHKLSLQNPSKRAYFAAKIEFLKKKL